MTLTRNTLFLPQLMTTNGYYLWRGSEDKTAERRIRSISERPLPLFELPLREFSHVSNPSQTTLRLSMVHSSTCLLHDFFENIQRGFATQLCLTKTLLRIGFAIIPRFPPKFIFISEYYIIVAWADFKPIKPNLLLHHGLSLPDLSNLVSQSASLAPPPAHLQLCSGLVQDLGYLE
jgi:hypothetical protein